MIKLTINLSKFDNNKLLAFGEGLNNSVKDLKGIDGALLPFQEKLLECTNAANNVAEKTKAKEVSEMIIKEDDARDNLLAGINKLFDACEYHPDTAVSDAAIECNQVLEKLSKNISRQAYDSESASIRTLLTDLTGDYAPQVETCSATAFVQALEQSQNHFDQIRTEQLQENVETSQIISMSSIRREFTSNIRAILQLLPLIYQVNQSPEFKTAIELTQQLIRKFSY